MAGEATPLPSKPAGTKDYAREAAFFNAGRYAHRMLCLKLGKCLRSAYLFQSGA